jgi:serine protease AprX
LLRGVAPGIKLIDLRVLDAYGKGADSGVIAAINQAVALKTKHNIRVINLSLGRPPVGSYTVDPLCKAVEAAWKAGIVVVVAAGNGGRDNSAGTNGYATIMAPGNDPYVITVGAMKTMGTTSRADDQIASYSSKGPTGFDHIVKPDILAPGNRVVSLLGKAACLDATYPTTRIAKKYYDSKEDDAYSPDYFQLSGTSMATPVVSGAVALMLQKDPTLTPDQVKARLMKTASKSFPLYSTTTDPVTNTSYTSQYDIFTIGAGYLDIWAALNNTEKATGTALSPSAVFDPINQTVSMVFPQGVAWGTGVVWGTGLVWGSNVIVNGTAVVWGSGVVWGTGGSPFGTAVVWGTGVVWGVSGPTGEAAIAVNGEN